jgi:hypothetical protein
MFLSRNLAFPGKYFNSLSDPAETMVLTTAQTAAFFHEEAQMGIPNPTVAQMQAEGITNVKDLADFDKESLQQLADNLRTTWRQSARSQSQR